MTHRAAQPAGSRVGVVLAWLAVGVPLTWGVWTTLAKALPLLRLGF